MNWLIATYQTGKKTIRIFAQGCHGANLEGQPNWRDFKKMGACRHHRMMKLGTPWHHDTEMLFNYTKLGGQATLEAVGVNNYLSGMPAFEELLSDLELGNFILHQIYLA